MSTVLTIRLCTKDVDASAVSEIPDCYGIARTKKRNNLNELEQGFTIYHDGTPVQIVETFDQSLRLIAEREKAKT